MKLNTNCLAFRQLSESVLHLPLYCLESASNSVSHLLLLHINTFIFHKNILQQALYARKKRRIVITSRCVNTTIIDIPWWLYMYIHGSIPIQDIMLNNKYHIKTNRYESKTQLCWIPNHSGPSSILSERISNQLNNR